MDASGNTHSTPNMSVQHRDRSYRNGIAFPPYCDHYLSSTFLKSYLFATRPWSFSASMTPVFLGCALAYKATGSFNLCAFIATLATVLFIHAAGNVVNTYFDYVTGVDDKKSDDRTLVDGVLKPNQIILLGGMLYLCGCTTFLMVAFISSASSAFITLIYAGGVASSFVYTGGWGLKYIGLGDIAIVLTFGPLVVMFSFLTQTGTLSIAPILYAIPLALNTEAILHCNNVRDVESDKRGGIVTLAIILGSKLSYVVFVALLFTPYIIILVIGLSCTKWMFLPVTTVVLAFQHESRFRSGNLTAMPQEIAKLNLLLGALFVLACMFAESGSLPHL